jgi:signal transduction histidine kinase
MKISMCMNNIQYSTSNAMQNMPEIAEINDNIKITNNSIDYLTVMINKIQNQIKDIVLEESQNNLGDIIDKALNMVIPFTKDRNTNIVKNFSNDLYILCDSTHLQETFINILNNAIEAIGANGEIKIDIYEDKKFITVAIKDNGPGISKDNLPRVVDPFFSTKNRTQNFGLGLSYCYSVMQQHGGRLDIQSEEGMGTKVLVSFPIKRKLRKKFSPDSIGVEYL